MKKEEPLWMMARLPFPDNDFLELQTDIILSDDEMKKIKERVSSEFPIGIKNFVDLKILEDVLSPNKKVLEIGTGFGEIAQYFIQNSKGFYYGLEPDEQRYNFTNSLFGNNERVILVKEVIENVKFPDDYFDYIFSYMVFEHLKNPISFLEKTRKMLRLEGRTIIACPNVDGLHPRLNLFSWRQTFPTHRWLPSKRTLFKALEYTGFEVERYFTYGGFSAKKWPSKKSALKYIGNKVLRLFDLGDQIVVLAKKRI